jgi:ElaB/YqjD/DUF883 family membrane-anchored ribosome-binding protein
MAKSNASLNGSRNTVSVDDLSAQIDLLKNDLANLTQTLSDYSVAKSQDANRAARDTAAEVQTLSRDAAHKAQAQAEEFVQNQPATSLGLAAGLGFLVGMMTARR